MNGPQKHQIFLNDDQPGPSSGVVTVNGAELRYVIEGRGVPCLVIGSATYYPRTFSQALREHFQFIFVDLRHFAPSTTASDIDQITIDTYLNDIEQIRSALGLDKLAVLGHSVHGTLALEYARRYPDHTSQVIAVGALPVGLGQLTMAAEAFWEADASAERSQVWLDNWQALDADAMGKMSPEEALIRTYLINGPKYWRDPHYDAAWLWAGVEVNIEISNHVFGLMFEEYDIAKEPRPITPPVFFALGCYDYIVPYSIWEGKTEMMSHLSYHLFEQSGHTPQLEEQPLFDRKLIEWMSSQQHSVAKETTT